MKTKSAVTGPGSWTFSCPWSDMLLDLEIYGGFLIYVTRAEAVISYVFFCPFLHYSNEFRNDQRFLRARVISAHLIKIAWSSVSRRLHATKSICNRVFIKIKLHTHISEANGKSGLAEARFSPSVKVFLKVMAKNLKN